MADASPLASLSAVEERGHAYLLRQDQFSRRYVSPSIGADPDKMLATWLRALDSRAHSLIRHIRLNDAYYKREQFGSRVQKCRDALMEKGVVGVSAEILVELERKSDGGWVSA